MGLDVRDVKMAESGERTDRLSAEEEIMVRVSWLYYRGGFTQQEIADKLHLSRAKVGRLLAKSLEEGIVEINLSPRANLINLSLESQLEKRFDLREALIVPTRNDPGKLLENLGRAAGRFLDRSLNYEFTLGISLGTSVSATLPFVTPRNPSDSTVLTLSGGFTQPDHDVSRYDISWPLADTLGAKLEVLYCPLVAESPSLKEALLSDQKLAAQLKRAEDVDVALVSIGFPHYEMPLYRLGFCERKDVDNLVEAGAVGELIITFFDINGQFVHTSLYDRSIGVPFETLKKIPVTVGIGGGLEKKEAILGALRSGALDVLITDELTAEEVLKLDQQLSENKEISKVDHA
jgi:DNA-binding transcriptional regulator LsrR (DeoR family)